MGNFAPSQIDEYNRSKWKCSDFAGLCDSTDSGHGDDKHMIIWIPEEYLGPNVTQDSINLEYEGNAVKLHIGDELRGKYEKKDGRLTIRPGSFLFFLTREVIHLPFDIDGNLFQNPSVSNMGLLFFTLGHVDPGFHGHLTATLLNTTDKPISLEEHEGCLYLVLSRMEKVCSPHRCHYEPQLSLSQAQKNLYSNTSPAFALTSDNFVTRREFMSWTVMLLAIVSILITVILANLAWGG